MLANFTCVSLLSFLTSDNSYSMQIITGNKLTLGGLWTNTYRLANPLINLRSDLIYVDGIGTKNNPYQIALP